MTPADRSYVRIRRRARRIVSRFPPPAFYADFPVAVRLSRKFFNEDPRVSRLHAVVRELLEEDFGHGLTHAVKVTLDAGALAAIECLRAGWDRSSLCRRIRLAQMAGLLHDLRRKESEHAIAGAETARLLLGRFALRPSEVEDVAMAIRNHEAFRPPDPVSTPGGKLISDCLYDADKFRWGPDNFTDTVWDMVTFAEMPLVEFMARYPKGMEMLARIGDTFRTETGRRYGPDFIRTGLAIGWEIYRMIEKEFEEEL
ncbi:MAG: hypothetical protein ACLFRG_22400 [Desulfococcaceae bacterium]